MEDQEEEPRDYLGNLGQQIKRHWQEHRPRMYRELELRGQLHQALVQARRTRPRTRSTACYIRACPTTRRGRSVREEWAFLPSEADEPAL